MLGCPLCELPHEQALHLERLYGSQFRAGRVMGWWKRHQEEELDPQVIKTHYAHHGVITGRRAEANALLGTTLPQRQSNLLQTIYRHDIVYTQTLLSHQAGYANLNTARSALYRDLRHLMWSGYLYRFPRKQMQIWTQDPGMMPLQARNSVYRLTQAGREWLRLELDQKNDDVRVVSDQRTLQGQSFGVKLGQQHPDWRWDAWYTGIRWGVHDLDGVVKLGDTQLMYNWDDGSMLARDLFARYDALLEQAKGGIVLLIVADRRREGELLKAWRAQQMRWQGIEHAKVYSIRRDLLWSEKETICINIENGQAITWSKAQN